jgi:hypothetical protein
MSRRIRNWAVFLLVLVAGVQLCSLPFPRGWPWWIEATSYYLVGALIFVIVIAHLHIRSLDYRGRDDNRIFVYGLQLYSDEPTVVAQGAKEFVERFVTKKELEKLFGGWLLSRADDGSSYLGVWGARKASQFRRLLQERGAIISIVKGAQELHPAQQYKEKRRKMDFLQL